MSFFLLEIIHVANTFVEFSCWIIILNLLENEETLVPLVSLLVFIKLGPIMLSKPPCTFFPPSLPPALQGSTNSAAASCLNPALQAQCPAPFSFLLGSNSPFMDGWLNGLGLEHADETLYVWTGEGPVQRSTCAALWVSMAPRKPVPVFAPLAVWEPQRAPWRLRNVVTCELGQELEDGGKLVREILISWFLNYKIYYWFKGLNWKRLP